VQYLPPAWLARFVETTGPAYSSVAWWIPLLFILATGAVWTAVMWRLSAAYAEMQPGGTAWRRIELPPLPRPGELAGRVARWLTRPHEERTAYWLCATMLRRDHQLRMRSWPMLGMVLAAVVLGLTTGQLANPATAHGSASVLSIVSIYLLAVPVPSILYNLNFSRDHAAAWVLLSGPIEDRAAFADGICKAVTYQVLAPAWVALVLVFALVWRHPAGVAAHALAAWLAILGARYASQMAILRDLPLAVPLVRGETMGPIALFAGILSGVAMSLAAVHYYVVPWWPGFLIYLASLVVVVSVLRTLARRVMERHFAVEVASDE
jgi:hypothetical protein